MYLCIFRIFHLFFKRKIIFQNYRDNILHCRYCQSYRPPLVLHSKFDVILVYYYQNISFQVTCSKICQYTEWPIFQYDRPIYFQIIIRDTFGVYHLNTATGKGGADIIHITVNNNTSQFIG